MSITGITYEGFEQIKFQMCSSDTLPSLCCPPPAFPFSRLRQLANTFLWMNKDKLQVLIFLRLLFSPSALIHTRLTFCKTGTDKNKDIHKYHVTQCGTKIAWMRELASFSCYFLALNSSFINVHSTYFQKCLNGIYTTTKHNIICTYRQILSKARAWKNALQGWLHLKENQCVLSWYNSINEDQACASSLVWAVH